MSDVFSQIGKAAQRVASNVASEVSIAAQEQRVNDAYRDLGRRYHELLRQNGAVDPADLEAQTRKVDQLLEELKEKRRKKDVTA